MLNNSGTYGPNESPTNMVASLNRSQSNASNITHNMGDFSKYLQQTASSNSEYYEGHNVHDYGQPPVNMAPVMLPFHAYQSVGQGSSYISQNTDYSYESAMQDLFTPGSSTIQSENSYNMLNFTPNVYPKSLSDLLTAPTKEPYFAKSYPLNVPQVSTTTFQKSPSFIKNDLNTHKEDENCMETQIRPETPSITDQNFTATDNVDSNSSMSSSPGNKNAPEDLFQEPTDLIDHSNVETPKKMLLNQNPPENISEVPTTNPAQEVPTNPVKKKTYFIVKNNLLANTLKMNTSKTNTSMLDNCMSESKRKSLNKTIQIIERILIRSSNSCMSSNNTVNRPENTEDPLALPPDNAGTSNVLNKDIDSETDSDSDALSTKVTLKSKQKIPTEKPLPQNSNSSSNIAVPSPQEVPINHGIIIKLEDIKVEPYYAEYESGNPYLRDTSGTLRESVGAGKIISMENSEEEALATAKQGSTSMAYFECPHCSLLLLHPKRFLIHTKWHSFGLLNQKREELAKLREERTKEKREARTIQRLSASQMGAAGDLGDPSVTYPCKDCSSIFPTKSSLRHHKRVVHSPPETQCKVCRLIMTDMKALREHMATHEVTGGHQCPHCDKRFKYRHSLTKHVDTHLDKTHSCTTCGKLFGSLALVRVHNVTHERAARGRIHRCSYCGKGFSETYNLNVHERTHRNDKPFQCETCLSCFVTNSSLKRHMKVSHGGAKPFTCPVCQKCFSSATIRDRHELRLHSDQRQLPFACPLCGSRFMKKKDLRNHTYKLHPKDKIKKEKESELNYS